MDISLTISLMRGQMGTVIERAVSAAVETVLGEMLRVVGIKFDELKMEVVAKEKEAENIRQMLEISRSQMKTMRKHMNALGENAHSATYQSYRTAFGHSDPRRIHGSSEAALGLPQPPRRTVPNNNQIPTTNGNVQARNRVTITIPSENMVRATQPSDNLIRATQPSDNLVRATQPSDNLVRATQPSDNLVRATQPSDNLVRATQPSDNLVRATQPSDNMVTVRATSTSFDSHDDLTTVISQTLEDRTLTPTVSARNSSSEHLEPLKEEPPALLDPEVSDDQRREEEEECQAEWTISTQPPETSTDPGAQLVLSPPRTDGADCSARSVLPSSQPLSQFQVKEEEAEVEIICIKQEPEEVETLLINLAAEGFNSQGNLLLDSHRTIPGSQSQRDRRAPRPPQSQRTLGENTPFTSADSCSYGLSQAVMSMSGVAPRPMVRPWPKDLSLYEEFKMRRTELRRRSQTRQREMEKNLPQPLLADLVKERREKTRLRVARWRAKRKLQACLLTQMTQQTQHQQTGPGLGQGNSLNSGLGNHSQISHPTQHKTTGPTQTPQRNSAAISQSQYNNSFLYNRSHCETGAGNVNYPPLQFNSSSLMLGQHGGHNMVEHIMQPTMTSSSQQGLSLTDSELYQ
ncbi:uncharacterized protein LOC118366450 [Oncorhynchus keta]|uniref:uncharacterized protein LOC118366450 n=1 Tax=Oncorhynchus keta TaxID=8018 RepID=UPI00227C1FEC|nr:uncharacterized protein LOC118366450 [Oncorhynchus keta]XP_052348656.1 uncharacterized protein LOC118366450 [Oncorhynchus keta]XP_052348657.1 uncharacterized protein LOC118366450 [Oncorhynchus keta]XP_052348658.1 uncharacterized protein LOC118366450 [Oncorhynchus keta]XP_052348659.1 uncharacterized protein LOC118366450 [Oncorhynchus keta]XP_052348661.1 uncharacterized protein LOC118366450 [Oncorhynchus keta]